MRLLLTGLILLLLPGCYAISKAQYESIRTLGDNYKALDARDKALSQQLDHLQQRRSASVRPQEH